MPNDCSFQSFPPRRGETPSTDFAVRAGSLAPLKAVAAAMALNLTPLLRGAGLEADALDDPEARVAAGVAAALLESAASVCRRPDLGLCMAQTWTLADLGPVSLVLVYHDTLREALRALAGHRPLTSDAIQFEIEDLGEHARLRLTSALPTGVEGRQLSEFAVGAAAKLCRTFLGSGWLPITAAFRHGPPAETALHRRIFGRDPEFGAPYDGLLLRRTDLDTRAPRLVDPSLRQHAEALISQIPSRKTESVAERAARQIRQRLSNGDANLAGVARALDLTPRTLQRRLQAEGVVFSVLLDAVRGEVAKAYLSERSMPLGQIAERLGYADGSAFTRWFTDQYGEPPSRWREGARRPDGGGGGIGGGVGGAAAPA